MAVRTRCHSLARDVAAPIAAPPRWLPIATVVSMLAGCVDSNAPSPTLTGITLDPTANPSGETLGPEEGEGTEGGPDDSTTAPTSTSTTADPSAGESPDTTDSGAGEPGGGYVVTGDWHGYAWTYTDSASTINPTSFETVGAGEPLCVAGTVAPSADYSGVAMLGINVNQAAGNDPPVMSATPTRLGVAINVTNNAGSPLRVQIQGPNGETDGSQRWCADVTGSNVLIPYSEFNTECWPGGAGVAYDGSPIVAVMFPVPGGAEEGVPFDYCVNGFADGDTPEDAGLGGGGDTGAGTISESTGWRAVTRDGRNYIVQNNVWGNGSQTISYESTSFRVESTQQSGSGVLAFPSVFIGSNHDRATSGSNLPIAISAIQSIQTTFSHNAGQVGGSYNASYDVWFSTGAGGDTGQPSCAYLMVWSHKPGDQNPVWDGGGRPTANIAGRTWDIYRGILQSEGRQVTSYVVQGGQSVNSMTFDLNEFIQHAVQQGYLNGSCYLTNVFAGFEIWNGGTGLQVSDFSAVVE